MADKIKISVKKKSYDKSVDTKVTKKDSKIPKLSEMLKGRLYPGGNPNYAQDSAKYYANRKQYKPKKSVND